MPSVPPTPSFTPILPLHSRTVHLLILSSSSSPSSAPLPSGFVAVLRGGAEGRVAAGRSVACDGWLLERKHSPGDERMWKCTQWRRAGHTARPTLWVASKTVFLPMPGGRGRGGSEWMLAEWLGGWTQAQDQTKPRQGVDGGWDGEWSNWAVLI